MSWERNYHVGDAFPPLIARFSYGPDSGLELADDLTTGLTYTFNMWDAGTDALVIASAAASCDSATANVVQLRYAWAADDLDTAGRYLVRFRTLVGGKAVWLPGEGRQLYVNVRALAGP